MIDIKKKVQAAKDYASKSYRVIRKISNSGFIVQRDENADKHFLDGIDWAEKEIFKDLLHPASEEPRKGAKFLYQNHYNSRFYYYIGKIDDILETYPNWSSYVKHVRVIQWLYIDDLFPKEGGEK